MKHSHDLAFKLRCNWPLLGKSRLRKEGFLIAVYSMLQDLGCHTKGEKELSIRYITHGEYGYNGSLWANR